MKNPRKPSKRNIERNMASETNEARKLKNAIKLAEKEVKEWQKFLEEAKKRYRALGERLTPIC